MEVYYRDLISDDATLEKLVEDLTLLVQGTEDAATNLERQSQLRAQIRSLLKRVKHQANESATATDKAVREHPYTSAGLAFGIGLLIGFLLPSSSAD
jgi:ElaB/YqjD/DUF883 family membrane-anchored ribosome-binding protein